MKYFWRILASPFIFVVILIAAIRKTVITSIRFVKYGGEITMYPKEPKTITDVFNYIADKYKEDETKAV